MIACTRIFILLWLLSMCSPSDWTERFISKPIIIQINTYDSRWEICPSSNRWRSAAAEMHDGQICVGCNWRNGMFAFYLERKRQSASGRWSMSLIATEPMHHGVTVRSRSFSALIESSLIAEWFHWIWDARSRRTDMDGKSVTLLNAFRSVFAAHMLPGWHCASVALCTLTRRAYHCR